MLLYWCEDVRAEQFSVNQSADLADQFFDINYKLKAMSTYIGYPFEISIRNYKIIEAADVLSTAALMRKCLRLDPTQRTSAIDLLSHPWFDGIV